MKIKIFDTLVILSLIGVNILLYRVFAVTPTANNSASFFRLAHSFLVLVSLGTFYFLYNYINKKMFQSSAGSGFNILLIFILITFIIVSFANYQQGSNTAGAWLIATSSGIINLLYLISYITGVNKVVTDRFFGKF